MSGINKVILIGHLGKDPELRSLDGGVSVTSFPLATSETFNKDGQKVGQTNRNGTILSCGGDWLTLLQNSCKKVSWFILKGN